MDGHLPDAGIPASDVPLPVQMVHIVYHDSEDELDAPHRPDAPAQPANPPALSESVEVPSADEVESSLAVGQKCLDAFLTGK